MSRLSKQPKMYFPAQVDLVSVHLTLCANLTWSVNGLAQEKVGEKELVAVKIQLVISTLRIKRINFSS